MTRATRERKCQGWSWPGIVAVVVAFIVVFQGVVLILTFPPQLRPPQQSQPLLQYCPPSSISSTVIPTVKEKNENELSKLRIAFVTLFDWRPEHPYTSLVCLLGQRLKLHHPDLDRILLYDGQAVDEPTLHGVAMLTKFCGWTSSVPVPNVATPSCIGTSLYAKQSLKLWVWQLINYDMIVYLDSDHWIAGPLDGLLSSAWQQLSFSGEKETKKTVGVVGCRAHLDSYWVQREKANPTEFILNGGTLLLRPNQTEFDRIVSFHTKAQSMHVIDAFGLDCTEMGMLNAAFFNTSRTANPVTDEALYCPDPWKISNEPGYICHLIESSRKNLPLDHPMHGIGPALMHSFKGYSEQQLSDLTQRGVLPNAWLQTVLFDPIDRSKAAVEAEFPAIALGEDFIHPSKNVCQSGT